MTWMKALALAVLIVAIAACPPLQAGDAVSLETYLRDYTYASRLAMKADSRQLIDWIEDGRAVLVDIRFAEEQQAWGAGFGLKIPLNQLPSRLHELPKDKIIVAACPHRDRAIIAMVFLKTRGYDARYLTDGLVGLFENLRGDNAKYFIEMMPPLR